MTTSHFYSFLISGLIDCTKRILSICAPLVDRFSIKLIVAANGKATQEEESSSWGRIGAGMRLLALLPLWGASACLGFCFRSWLSISTRLGTSVLVPNWKCPKRSAKGSVREWCRDAAEILVESSSQQKQRCWHTAFYFNFSRSPEDPTKEYKRWSILS